MKKLLKFYIFLMFIITCGASFNMLIIPLLNASNTMENIIAYLMIPCYIIAIYQVSKWLFPLTIKSIIKLKQKIN